MAILHSRDTLRNHKRGSEDWVM